MEERPHQLEPRSLEKGGFRGIWCWIAPNTQLKVGAWFIAIGFMAFVLVVLLSLLAPLLPRQEQEYELFPEPSAMFIALEFVGFLGCAICVVSPIAGGVVITLWVMDWLWQFFSKWF